MRHVYGCDRAVLAVNFVVASRSGRCRRCRRRFRHGVVVARRQHGEYGFARVLHIGSVTDYVLAELFGDCAVALAVCRKRQVSGFILPHGVAAFARFTLARKYYIALAVLLFVRIDERRGGNSLGEYYVAALGVALFDARVANGLSNGYARGFAFDRAVRFRTEIACGVNALRREFEVGQKVVVLGRAARGQLLPHDYALAGDGHCGNTVGNAPRAYYTYREYGGKHI